MVSMHVMGTLRTARLLARCLPPTAAILQVPVHGRGCAGLASAAHGCECSGCRSNLLPEPLVQPHADMRSWGGSEPSVRCPTVATLATPAA